MERRDDPLKRGYLTAQERGLRETNPLYFHVSLPALVNCELMKWLTYSLLPRVLISL